MRVPSPGRVPRSFGKLEETAVLLPGGTTVLSDWLVVKVTANPGEGFLDKMISLIEGAKRQKTPNEIALNILLISLTAIFIFVCATLYAFSWL